MLGAPPRGFVVPWSEASIAGHALERVLTQVQLSRIEGRVAHLWPPGPYALGLAAARVAEAVLSSSRRTFSVLTLLGGEFGARGRVGVLPAILSQSGDCGHARTHTEYPGTRSGRKRAGVGSIFNEIDIPLPGRVARRAVRRHRSRNDVPLRRCGASRDRDRFPAPAHQVPGVRRAQGPRQRLCRTGSGRRRTSRSSSRPPACSPAAPATSGSNRFSWTPV